MSTQAAEQATRLGRNPGWWLLATKKAMREYAITHMTVRHWPASHRDAIRAEAAAELRARVDQLLYLAEHSTSGEEH